MRRRGFCERLWIIATLSLQFVLWLTLTQDSKLEIYFPVGHNFYLDGSVKEGEGGRKAKTAARRWAGPDPGEAGTRSCSVWHHEDPGPALLRHSHKVHPAPPAALQHCRGWERESAATAGETAAQAGRAAVMKVRSQAQMTGLWVGESTS